MSEALRRSLALVVGADAVLPPSAPYLRDAAQWPKRAVELHGEIKRLFDPKGLLNPGKKL